MSKYIKSQSRKMLSAYGGVGSILETAKGALKIEEFDKWYFHYSGSCNIPEYEIEENRLIGRLKSHFPKLQKLVKVPTNEENHLIKSLPIKPKEVASAKYFPEWMYCPNCERFNNLKQWWGKWRMTLQRHKINDDRIKELFIKPKCFHCYDKAKTEKKGRLYQELEQVRFILTSPSGDIQDIPWHKWTTIEKNVKEEDSENGSVKFNDPCCDKQDLRYIRSETFADLAGVRIQCKNSECPSKGKQVTLAGLFGMRIGKEKITQFKPVIRTSNSVYYPLSINSIYLPKKVNEIKVDDKETIKTLLANGVAIEVIYLTFQNRYDKQTIDDFIESETNTEFEPEIKYRLKEYQFIIDNPNYNDEEKNNLKYENQDLSIMPEFSISTLLKVKRLKLTTVQTAYTRQEPLDKDLFLSDGDASSNVKVKYTSSQAVNTSYLLASESYGEGIFIDFDKQKIEEWFYQHYDNTPAFRKRIDDLKKRISENKMLSKNKFQSERHLAKFIFVHTFSHILIKELEFLCGYAATSLNERLFVDDENMQGVLIYTVAGSEGSYGGLTSQANPESIKKILHSAIFRSKDCASDPVCYHSDGQGIGGLNLAACYSCALLPETSCEEFNSFLDRALLTDSEFGFLGHIV
jgi:Domain of unknown function (DUF1998)